METTHRIGFEFELKAQKNLWKTWKTHQKRGPAMIGELPGDFLRSDAQLNRSHGEQASQA